MSVGEKLPWLWNKNRKRVLPVLKEEHPFGALQRQMNSLFDDFLTAFDESPLAGFSPSGLVQKWGGFNPKVDVVENEQGMEVTAELPGMDEKNIDLKLTKDYLTLTGEKSEEHKEEKPEGRRYVERSYGSFERVIPLTIEVDEDKVEASFKNGVLKIKLPRSGQSVEKSKKISIKS